jgi:nitrous oxidase accessory protein
MRSQLAATLFVFGLTVRAASGAELRVGDGERLHSIAAALAEARAGDTIRVAAGTYHENLVVRTPVSILGEGRPQLAGNRRGDVVRIEAPHVLLRGFEIRGSGEDMMGSDSGVRIRGAHARVLDNALSDNLFGVYLDRSEDALVEGNRIVGRRELSEGLRGPGVHLYDARHNRIRRNRVRFVRDGVYFDHADANSVEENDLAHLRYGIHYMYCSDNRFERNVMRESSGGAAIMYSERVVFRDNQILHNRDSYNAFGLLLQACEGAVAERNVIVGNVHGIFIEGSHRNRFEHNLVAFNDVGVFLFASALENRFANNDFIGNTAVLHTVGRAHADWSPAGQGNYYSDYRGYDLDGDGRGDIPYRLQDAFEYLEGNHPLLRLYLSSAAASALAVAERAFPVIPAGEEWDRAPAMRPVSGVRLRASAGGAAPWPGRVAFALLSTAALAAAAVILGRLRR